MKSIHENVEAELTFLREAGCSEIEIERVRQETSLQRGDLSHEYHRSEHSKFKSRSASSASIISVDDEIAMLRAAGCSQAELEKARKSFQSPSSSSSARQIKSPVIGGGGSWPSSSRNSDIPIDLGSDEEEVSNKYNNLSSGLTHCKKQSVNLVQRSVPSSSSSSQQLSVDDGLDLENSGHGLLDVTCNVRKSSRTKRAVERFDPTIQILRSAHKATSSSSSASYSTQLIRSRRFIPPSGCQQYLIMKSFDHQSSVKKAIQSNLSSAQFDEIVEIDAEHPPPTSSAPNIIHLDLEDEHDQIHSSQIIDLDAEETSSSTSSSSASSSSSSNVVKCQFLEPDENIDDESAEAYVDYEPLRGCICMHCILEAKTSPLIETDLSTIVNFDNFRQILSDSERSALFSLLPASDSLSSHRLRDMFSYIAEHVGHDGMTTIEYFQELLATRNLDSTIRNKFEVLKTERLSKQELYLWRRADMWSNIPSVVPAEFQKLAQKDAEVRLKVPKSKARKGRDEPKQEELRNLRMFFEFEHPFDEGRVFGL